MYADIVRNKQHIARIDVRENLITQLQERNLQVQYNELVLTYNNVMNDVLHSYFTVTFPEYRPAGHLRRAQEKTVLIGLRRIDVQHIQFIVRAHSEAMRRAVHPNLPIREFRLNTSIKVTYRLPTTAEEDSLPENSVFDAHGIQQYPHVRYDVVNLENHSFNIQLEQNVIQGTPTFVAQLVVEKVNEDGNLVTDEFLHSTRTDRN